MTRNFLIVDPDDGALTLKALGSPVRIGILNLLQEAGAMNVNALAARLALPQSSVSAHVQVLEEGGLIRTETLRARKGNQKLCHALYDEVVVRFRKAEPVREAGRIEVAMPLGLYTSCEVTAPCGLCSADGIIGLLDVPSTFLEPARMSAGLLWFTRGHVEYQFPNNSKMMAGELAEVEFLLELSSEVPGTAEDWPSDISFAVNQVEVGTWTSPGDFGDQRGVHTPAWWTLKGSQYGMLKSLRVTREGSFIDGMRISPVTLADLDLAAHRSIRLRISVKAEAGHPGGVNIFGRGFGNYDQDIVMRLATAAERV